jgi:hypothetical protein
MQEREGEVFRLECFPVNFAIVQIMVTACRFVLCLFDLFLFTFLTGTSTPPHTHNKHNRLQTLPTQQPHHFMSTTTASAAGSASADASGGGANLSLHTPSLVGLFVASCMHHVLCVDACRGPRWNTAKSDFIPFH